MSDITAAPEQAEIADSLVSEEEQQQPVEATEAEQQETVETTEQPLEQEQQEQVEETAEDWLPSEQDKVFPDEVYARYAQRYNLTPEQAQEPTLRQLLHDKINSDIYIQQQQQFEQEPEPEAPAEPTREQPLSREQYFQNLDRAIAERTDPQVATQFHAEFLKAFGVPDAEIAKTSPQQAMAFTHTASKYMLNLMNTFAPDLFAAQLQQQVNQIFPGFGDMYERSSMAMAWDRVRNSDPTFAALPSYGTKEFSSKLREAAARIPGFDEMQFTDAQGKPLPAQQNAERKYAMLAKIASGQNVNPQLLQQAAAAGARNARRADVKRSAGNLGSGQSKGASGGSKPVNGMQSNTDLFDEDTMEYYHQQHGRL
jgi:hypothetical protein